MPPDRNRSRSNTTASTKSTRPASRASTTSMRSSAQRSPVEMQFAPSMAHPQHQHMPESAQGLSQNQQQQLLMAVQSMSGNGIHAQHPLDTHMEEPHQMQEEVQVFYHPGMQSQTTPDLGGHHHHYRHQSLVNAAAVASGAETDERRKKGSATSAANDKELRELLQANNGRSLKEVAHEVSATERTAKAEKTKQLFAMLWLQAVCKVAKTSVPRSRVYSHYADRCATERVVPLNPASFGKLVRVIFPGIQTRRLGVRGESKYHYVDLALFEDAAIEEPAERVRSAQSVERQARHQSVSAHIDFNNMPRLPADTAAFPPESRTLASPIPAFNPSIPSQGRLFTNPNEPGMNTEGPIAGMYEQHLKFPSLDEPPFMENESVVLPDIQPYLPPNTDADTASALTALYRTHCTSLVDCIRFCKEKQFFRLFTSFHGTLTVPVQKLLAHPKLAPWIQECDWMMYQKMTRFVAPLALQVIPPQALAVFDNISRSLHSHIHKTFQNHPLHVLEAKLKPATIFAGLLHRLLKVNSAAHAAANILIVDQNRDALWQEWVSMVNPKRVAESELPNCGYEDVYKILTQDVRTLLEPLSAPAMFDVGTFYEKEARSPGSSFFGPAGFQGNPNDHILDRWSNFFRLLPSRFPKADARTLLYCINAVGTAAIRDMTVGGGVTFSLWWITKIFVDELAQWLAVMGGFLDHQMPELPQSPFQASQESLAENLPQSNANGTNGSHFNSMDAAGNMSNDLGYMSTTHSAGNGGAVVPDPKVNQDYFSNHQHAGNGINHPQDANDALDDSGIGLMDEDHFGFKFTLPMSSGPQPEGLTVSDQAVHVG